MIKRIARGAAVGISMMTLGGALVTGAGTAMADDARVASEEPITVLGTCGDYLSPVIRGGNAHWTVQCSNGSVRLNNGWVKDTLADGYCVRVRAEYGNGTTWYSPQACGAGTEVDFVSPYRTGRVINAYLQKV